MLEETVNERYEDMARLADPTIVCQTTDAAEKD